MIYTRCYIGYTRVRYYRACVRGSGVAALFHRITSPRRYIIWTHACACFYFFWKSWLTTSVETLSCRCICARCAIVATQHKHTRFNCLLSSDHTALTHTLHARVFAHEHMRLSCMCYVTMVGQNRYLADEWIRRVRLLRTEINAMANSSSCSILEIFNMIKTYRYGCTRTNVICLVSQM